METPKLSPELITAILDRASSPSGKRPSLISCFRAEFLRLSQVRKGGDVEAAMHYARLVRLYYMLLTFADYTCTEATLFTYWESVCAESL